MGVDRAIHVLTEPKEYETLQPLHVSKILSKIATEEKVDLVIVGKQVSNCTSLYSCTCINIMNQFRYIHVRVSDQRCNSVFSLYSLFNVR